MFSILIIKYLLKTDLYIVLEYLQISHYILSYYLSINHINIRCIDE